MHASSGDHHAYHAKDPATVSSVSLSRATLMRRHRRYNRSAFFQRDAADQIWRGTRRRFPFAEDHSRDDRPATAPPNQVSRGPSPNNSAVSYTHLDVYKRQGYPAWAPAYEMTRFAAG